MSVFDFQVSITSCLFLLCFLKFYLDRMSEFFTGEEYPIFYEEQIFNQQETGEKETQTSSTTKSTIQNNNDLFLPEVLINNNNNAFISANCYQDSVNHNIFKSYGCLEDWNQSQVYPDQVLVLSKECQHLEEEKTKITTCNLEPFTSYIGIDKNDELNYPMIIANTSSGDVPDYGSDTQSFDYYEIPESYFILPECQISSNIYITKSDYNCDINAISSFTNKEKSQDQIKQKRKFKNRADPSIDAITKQKALPWSSEEEQELSNLIQSGITWSNICKRFPHRSSGAIKKHFYAHMKSVKWTKEEDDYLIKIFKEYEEKKWKTMVQELGKSLRSCKKRFRELGVSDNRCLDGRN